MRRLTETRRPVLWLVGGRLTGLVSVGLPMVLARLFAPAEFGAYRQLFLLYGTLYLIAQLGMAEALYYFVPRARDQAGRYVANAVVALGATGALSLLLLVGAAGPLAALLGDAPAARWLPLLGVFLFGMLASAGLEAVLVSERRYRAAACAYGLSDVVRTGLMLAPALITRSIGALLWGAVAFAALRLAATLAVLARLYGRAARPSLALAGRQLGYALPFAAAVVVDTLHQQLHLYVIANRFEPATFALYSVACFQIPFVDFLVTSVGNVLMVRLGQAHDAAAARELFGAAAARLALFLFPLVAFITVAGGDLITVLFGATYEASGPLFVLASLLVLLAVIPSDAMLRASAETHALFALGLLRLAALAVLLPLLLAAAGLAGALIATLGAAALAKGAALARIADRLDADLGQVLPWRVLGRTALAAGAAAAAAFLVGEIEPQPLRLARLALGGAVFAGAYLLLALRLGLTPRPAPTLAPPCAASQES
jgi:O-antigen/teichoic acid export membrane protein